MEITIITPETAPALKGCTILNEGGMWASVAEPTDTSYREALLALKANLDGTRPSDSLCGVQTRYMAAYASVAPEWCIRGDGYWYLRRTGNLGDSHPAGYHQFATLRECLEYAVQWHSEAPKRREVVAHVRDLERHL